MKLLAPGWFRLFFRYDIFGFLFFFFTSISLHNYPNRGWSKIPVPLRLVQLLRSLHHLRRKGSSKCFVSNWGNSVPWQVHWAGSEHGQEGFLSCWNLQWLFCLTSFKRYEQKSLSFYLSFSIIYIFCLVWFNFIVTKCIRSIIDCFGQMTGFWFNLGWYRTEGKFPKYTRKS